MRVEVGEQSFQIVGTAPETVGLLAAINRRSGSACRKRSGITATAPAISAAYGRPQAFAWNIGTIGRTRSSASAPTRRPCATAIECRQIERWL